MAKYQTESSLLYDDIAEICGKTLATGVGAYHAGAGSCKQNLGKLGSDESCDEEGSGGDVQLLFLLHVFELTVSK
jgi:hypothetical protein